jgi:hypothetical protein
MILLELVRAPDGHKVPPFGAFLAAHAQLPATFRSQPMPARHAAHPSHHYRHLLIMTALSFAAMYLLMYAMTDRFANVYNNINQVYMAGLMAAAMVLIELAVMRGMYPRRTWNIAIAAAGIIALAAFWALIRDQGAVGDRQFLRSMIPHHASAILMCEKAPIRDAEIRQLCQSIVASQADEIRQMKAKLAAL